MPTTISGTATSFITFSRASTATRVNASGIIESVAANTPRLDYNPVTLAPRGLLVEEQRSNLLLRSAEFDNAAWIKANITMTANSTVSPAGTTDADTVSGTTAGTVNYILQNVVATATVYTYSIWVMAGTATTCVLLLRDGTAASNFTVTASVLSGPGSVSGTTTITVSGLSTTQWTRVALTTTAAATAGNTIQAWFYPETSSLSTTAKSNIVWGAQLEEDSFATSYIPTLAASATRSADVASVATSSFPYNAAGGTLVLNFQYTNAASDELLNNRTAVAFHTAASPSNRIAIYNGTNIKAAGYVQNSTLQCLIGASGVQPADTPLKVAFAFGANDFALSQDGGAVATDTSGTIPSVDTLSIGGAFAAGNKLSGHIRQITYIPRRLTNAELQTRST